ncbi:MAG: DNA alkylation repair protein [Candidatus Thorarchaeota archaeon]
MIDKIINEIRMFLKNNAPPLTKDQKSRMYKIVNSDNPHFVGYGIKHSDIEKFVRKIHLDYDLSYKDASEIFNQLIQSNVHDEKITAVFLLNRFKKDFRNKTVDMIKKAISEFYDSWAITDTTMIRVLGPYLAKTGNEELASKTMKEWSHSENLWVRRAALVILLKIVMVNKDFNIDTISKLVEQMYEDPEEYVHKGIGWLLKTCSNYNPEIIFEYLKKNKRHFSRTILRTASEKLPKDKRAEILKK